MLVNWANDSLNTQLRWLHTGAKWAVTQRRPKALLQCCVAALVLHGDNDPLVIQMDDDGENLLVSLHPWPFVLLLTHLSPVTAHLVSHKLLV